MSKDALADKLAETELDDELELDDEADDEGDELDDEEVVEEWKPPTKEEWEITQGKLKRARTQAQKLREASKGKPKPKDEAEVAKDNAELERWQLRAIRSDAKSGLLERGADPEMVELALAKLKPAEVEFNDDDDPDLEDWLDEMEERYPKLFVKEEVAPKQRRKPGTIDQGAGNNGRPQKPAKTFGQLLIERSEAPKARRPRV